MKNYLVFVLLTLSSVPAMSAEFFFGSSGGTLGLGFAAGVDLGKVRLRIQHNDYEFEDTVSFDGEDYEFDLDLASTGLLVDYAPNNGVFYLSAGLYDNNNSITAISEEGLSILIGDAALGAGENATVKARFDDFSPYVGFGFNFFNNRKTGFGCNLDIGVYMNGSGDVEVTTTDDTFNATFSDDINQEEENIEDDIEDYELYPVVKLGIDYKF